MFVAVEVTVVLSAVKIAFSSIANATKRRDGLPLYFLCFRFMVFGVQSQSGRCPPLGFDDSRYVWFHHPSDVICTRAFKCVDEVSPHTLCVVRTRILHTFSLKKASRTRLFFSNASRTTIEGLEAPRYYAIFKSTLGIKYDMTLYNSYDFLHKMDLFGHNIFGGTPHLIGCT